MGGRPLELVCRSESDSRRPDPSRSASIERKALGGQQRAATVGQSEFPPSDQSTLPEEASHPLSCSRCSRCSRRPARQRGPVYSEALLPPTCEDKTPTPSPPQLLPPPPLNNWRTVAAAVRLVQGLMPRSAVEAGGAGGRGAMTPELKE